MRAILLVAFVGTSLITTSLIAQQADIDQLIKDTTARDRSVVIKAINELGKLGPDAASAVDALARAVGSDDFEIRWQAARALGSIGPAAKRAAVVLHDALTDEAPSVRAYAAFALGRLGKTAEPSVDQLIKNVFDKEMIVRRASIRALRSIDPPIQKTMPLVLKILDQGDMSSIMPALHTLANEGKAAVPRLRAAMQSAKAAPWAAIVLAEIGPEAADAVPELTRMLGHVDPDARMQALLALGEIGSASKGSVPAIAEQLETSKFTQVQVAAAYALGKIKAKGGEADVALRKASKSDDGLLQLVSMWALARTNPEDKQLVEQTVRKIVSAFKSDDVNIRRAAARAAVEFDIDPKQIAPVLVSALRDKDPTVVANAVGALSAMGPKALQHIDDALQNKDLRQYAIQLIAKMGPEAESAVPALIKVVGQAVSNDADAEFLREAQFALAQIGPAAKSAVPALVKSLSSDNDQIRASASYALGRIGPGAAGAVPALRKAMQTGSPIVKLASVRALLQIQPRERRLAIIAVPLLMKALEHEHELVRAEAATALADLGPLGKPAIPNLKKLEKDKSELVRQAANSAIARLGG